MQNWNVDNNYLAKTKSPDNKSYRTNNNELGPNQRFVNPLELPKKKFSKSNVPKGKRIRNDRDMFMMNFKMQLQGFPV